MTNIISAGTCSAIVAAATISLMAQSPSPQTTAPPPQTTTQAPQTPTSPSTTTTPSTDKRVTVTGCLKPASASTDTAPAATGTAGTTGTSATTGTAGATDAANAQYVLADAAMSPSTAGAAQSAPAGGTTTTANASTQTYRLIANATALAPHVGKKLELTGTIVDESAATSSSTANQATPGSGPVLKVEAGKILAASCEE